MGLKIRKFGIRNVCPAIHYLINNPMILISTPAVPRLSRFMTPVVSEQFFHSAPMPKEIPNTSVY